MTYLLDLAGLRTVIDGDGEELVASSVLEIGDGISATYNSSTKRIRLEMDPGSAGETATPGSGLTSDWEAFDPQLFAEGDLPSTATQDVGEGPDLFVYGYKPVSGSYQIEITSTGGRGVGEFRWSDDGGSTWEAENVTIPADGLYELEGKHIWLTFANDTYNDNDIYSFTPANEPATPDPGTGGIVSAKWRLSGNELEIEGLIVAGSGADWGSGQLSFALPSGYEVDGDACFQIDAGAFGPIDLDLAISQAGATVYAVVPFIADGNRLYALNDLSSFLSFAHVKLRVPVVAVE